MSNTKKPKKLIVPNKPHEPHKPTAPDEYIWVQTSEDIDFPTNKFTLDVYDGYIEEFSASIETLENLVAAAKEKIEIIRSENIEINCFWINLVDNVIRYNKKTKIPLCEMCSLNKAYEKKLAKYTQDYKKYTEKMAVYKEQMKTYNEQKKVFDKEQMICHAEHLKKVLADLEKKLEADKT
jgi:hypothetical protein